MNLDIQVRIFENLQRHHRGRANAAPRAQIERELAINIEDRQFRAHYETLPVCSCPDGLFIPETPAEVEEYRRYLTPKCPPWVVDTKIRRILAAWPHLTPKPKEVQLGFPL